MDNCANITVPVLYLYNNNNINNNNYDNDNSIGLWPESCLVYKNSDNDESYTLRWKQHKFVRYLIYQNCTLVLSIQIG